MDANLLLVDDDRSFCTLIQKFLERCGYFVETASNGLAGLEKLNTTSISFDLILLDRQMPEMDGIALLKRIKADSRFKEIPVVMLTADNRQEDVILGLAEGAYYYLTKPITKDLLDLVINNALSDFNQKRKMRELIGHQTNSQNLLRQAEYSCRTLSEAQDLALLLADISKDPDRTFTGYMELLFNAVEHGNLGITYADKTRLLNEGRWTEEVESRLMDVKYSAREVRVVIKNNSSTCVVTIADQGEGFDWPAYLEFRPERAFDLHGRGIAMSKKHSFDCLEYLGNGSTVIATVNFPQPSIGA